MRSIGISGVICFGILLLANGVSAQEVAALHPERPVERPAAFMRVYGSAEPPRGFVQFCQENPGECTANSGIETRLAVSSQRLRELDEVNRRVNKSVVPETDMDHYGISEYWAFPMDGKGDCEDYALLKRHELMQLEWPSSALLMTVVMDENLEGHAVLTVRTTAGDFVLDNKVNDVRLWSNTSYQYLLRQSYANPQAWVFLDPMRGATPRPIAVVRPHH